MKHDKVQEITAEMRTLLNQHTLVMTNPATISLAETPQPEMDAYQARNDRLRELGEELSKLDGRILRAYRFRSVWIIQIVSTPPTHLFLDCLILENRCGGRSCRPNCSHVQTIHRDR
jgi:hypothetical protein